MDTARRGFSFIRHGPLDMRMNHDPDGSSHDDDDESITAADVINTFPPHALEDIFVKVVSC